MRKKVLKELIEERQKLEAEQKKTVRRGAVLILVIFSILVAVTCFSIENLPTLTKIVLIITPILITICYAQYGSLKRHMKSEEKSAPPKNAPNKNK